MMHAIIIGFSGDISMDLTVSKKKTSWKNNGGNRLL